MAKSVLSWAMLTVVFTFAVAIPADAQDKRKFAATSMNEVDADFALQGEYMGGVFVADAGHWRWQQVGLQVIALGDGKFDAVLYTGGLPGAGWNREQKVSLSGTRSGQALRLQEGLWNIDVHSRWANFSYADTQSVYCIEKIFRVSPTLGRPQPSGAVSLFDGTNTDLLKNGRMTDDGLLMEGADTRDAYQDFTLHLEFRLPYMAYARGQGRSNSGVYIQSRYEVQILDSFGLEGIHNECGGLYKQRRPDLNMCFPPLRWQTYDITFISPKFADDGKKLQNARLTVRHNGVLIHNNVEVTNKTGGGKPEGSQPLPTKLQNHGNPVRFRNIWLVELDGTRPETESPPVQFAKPNHGRRPHYVVGKSYAPRIRYASGGYHHRRPKPLHQYWRAELNPHTGRYQSVDYYSPAAPDHYGYWTN